MNKMMLNRLRPLALLLILFSFVFVAHSISHSLQSKTCLDSQAYRVASTDFVTISSSQLQNLTRILSYPLNDYVVDHSVKFNADNQTLAVSGIGGVTESDYMYLWYLAEGCFRKIGGVNDVGGNFVSFSRDGKLMLVEHCSTTTCRSVANVATGEEVGKFVYAEFVEFPEQELISYTNADNQERLLWNPNTYSDLIPTTSWLKNARLFSPDEQLFVTTVSNADILIWDTNTGTKVAQLIGSRKSGFSIESVSRLIFSPDSRWLASQSVGEQVRVWNARNGNLQIFPIDESFFATKFAFTADSRYFLYGQHVWDVEVGGIAFDLNGTRFEEFSPDRSFFVSISTNSVDFWDAGTFAHIHSLGFRNERVSNVSISPNGKLLAIATSHECGSERCGNVEIWAISDF